MLVGGTLNGSGRAFEVVPPNFRVWVRFEDGLQGEVDLSDLAGKGVFKRWIDSPSEFARVAVDSESGTIVWPGGLDVAPDRLYRDVAQAAGRAMSSGRT